MTTADKIDIHERQCANSIHKGALHALVLGRIRAGATDRNPSF
jgi:hypothetical protein